MFPCALLGCGTEVKNSVQKGKYKENKPNKPALKAGLVSEASLALVMAKPPCVLPLCFRRAVRINLETKESCCARPGVACDALLKDLCALVCRVPRVTQPCSCLPGLWGPRLSSLLPARSVWVYFISFLFFSFFKGCAVTWH